METFEAHVLNMKYLQHSDADRDIIPIVCELN